MANARKCDRCKKCYDPLNIEGRMGRFQNPFFQTSEDIKNHTVGEKLLNDHPADIWIDLCPSCADTFRGFMNGNEIPEMAYEKTLLNEVEDQRNKIDMLNGIINHYQDTIGDNNRRIILEVEDADPDDVKVEVLRFLRYLLLGDPEEPDKSDVVTSEIKIDHETIMKMLAKEDVERAEKITNKEFVDPFNRLRIRSSIPSEPPMDLRKGESDDNPSWDDVWATIKRVSGGDDDGG